MCKAKKVKRLGWAFAPFFSSLLGKTTELDESCFVRMKRQSKFGESCSQSSQASFGGFAIGEPHDKVIGVSYNDHFTF